MSLPTSDGEWASEPTVAATPASRLPSPVENALGLGRIAAGSVRTAVDRMVGTLEPLLEPLGQRLRGDATARSLAEERIRESQNGRGGDQSDDTYHHRLDDVLGYHIRTP